MIFISAGHNTYGTGNTQDSGARGSGQKEGILSIDFRDRVCGQLDRLGARYITDHDPETLREYLSRIKTGSGSIVIEYHFNAAFLPHVSGTLGLVPFNASGLNISFAQAITSANAIIMGIRNEGVKDETYSRRSRLGLMREKGLVCLSEICYITNTPDINKYFQYRDILAKSHAGLLVKYDQLLS